MALTQRRSLARGQSLAETVGMIAILVGLVPPIADGAIVAFAFWTNAETCKNAARAASMGEPAALKKDSPLKRAQQAIDRSSALNNYIHIDPICAVTESISAPLPTQPFGGPVNGTVTVTTKVIVSPPFFGRLLSKHFLESSASETYPYTWSMPCAAASISNKPAN